MPESVDDAIARLLRSLRLHLGLDVAFVSQLHGGERVFRYVDSGLDGCPVLVGDADPAEESYCQYVVEGQLPGFLRDPAAHPLTAGLAITRELPVGTHLSVPIRFSDGSVYGTLCSFGREVREGLDERDLAVVRLMADVVTGYVEEREGERRKHEQRRSRLRALTPGRDLAMVFQPIVGLSDQRVVGVEALARFPTLGEEPAQVFADAWQLGVGVELEVMAIRAALEHLPRMPATAYLAVNASPATLISEEFADVIGPVAPERLVVEVTEHAVVTDYDALVAAVKCLSDSGVRLAIDDAGTGSSGLHHILRLSPDIIKIDAALVRDVNLSSPRQAMISALMTFAARTRVAIVAEGIETAGEEEALRVLGVPHGQGFYLSRPEPHAGAARRGAATATPADASGAGWSTPAAPSRRA